MSRPQRRATRRLVEKQKAYEGMIKLSKLGGKEFTKPGRGKHW